MSETQELKITEEQFKNLLFVRRSGACNMFDRNCIQQLVDGITKEAHMEYITKFNTLVEKWGDE